MLPSTHTPRFLQNYLPAVAAAIFLPSQQLAAAAAFLPSPRMSPQLLSCHRGSLPSPRLVSHHRYNCHSHRRPYRLAFARIDRLTIDEQRHQIVGVVLQGSEHWLISVGWQGKARGGVRLARWRGLID